MRVAGMDPRFATKTMHAYLDYPVAASLVALPFMLGLGTSHPMAKWLAVITGVAAFVLTFFTDHKTGVIRILPYSFHLAVDFLVGVVFVMAPFALGLNVRLYCSWSACTSQKPCRYEWQAPEIDSGNKPSSSGRSLSWSSWLRRRSPRST